MKTVHMVFKAIIKREKNSDSIRLLRGLKMKVLHKFKKRKKPKKKEQKEEKLWEKSLWGEERQK